MQSIIQHGIQVEESVLKMAKITGMPLHQIGMERMLEGREGAMHMLLKALKLDFDEACLRPDLNPAPVNNANSYAARQHHTGSPRNTYEAYYDCAFSNRES